MIYRVMYYGGMSFAIIMFIVSVLIFIKLRIHRVFGDLTGITAKRAIKQLQENNIKLGGDAYPTGRTVKEKSRTSKRGLTASSLIKSTGALPKDTDLEGNIGPKHITSKLGNQETSLLQPTEETTLLYNGQETTLLQSNDAGVGFNSNETTLLSELQREQYFQLEVDLMVINTTEVI